MFPWSPARYCIHVSETWFHLCLCCQEQPDGAKEGNLDDDEDRKNPAYIPRKGAFYEHDTRLGDDAAEDKM